ncbi:hypothetical protein D3C86_1869600 [compost metagenome]
MRGTAGGVRHLAGYHLVSGDLRLSKFTEWDRLRATQVNVVRVVLVPAAELVRLLAYAGVPFAPPGLGLAVVHTVTNRPGHGDLASQGFAAGLAPECAGKDVAVSICDSHSFLQA